MYSETVVTTSANPVVEPTGVGTPADALGVTKRMSTSEATGNNSDDKPWRDRDLLHRLYWDEWMSIRDIADELGCDHKTVARWLKRHDIERRSEGHPAADRELRDPEKLRELYWGEYLSTAEIADRYDCSRRQISYWLDKHDIQIRDPGGDGRKHPWTRDDIPSGEVVERYTESDLTAKQIADRYDCTAKVILRILHEQGADVDNPQARGHKNPNWRGGKRIYHAVRSELGPTCWPIQRERHLGNECESCGESDTPLELHHIVPLMAGGTNAEYNYMTLCAACHNTVEAHTRDLPGMEAVLVG